MAKRTRPQRAKYRMSLVGRIECLFSGVILLGCLVVSILTQNSAYQREFEALKRQLTLELSTMAQNTGMRAAQVEIVARELAFDKDTVALFEQKTIEQYMVQLLFAVQENVELSESHLNSLNVDIVFILGDETLPEGYELAVHGSRLAQDAYFRQFMRSDALEGWGPVALAMPVSNVSGDVIPYYRKVCAGMNTVVGVVRCAVSANKLFEAMEGWDACVRVLREGEEAWRIGDVRWPMPRTLESGCWVEGETLYVSMPVEALGVTLLQAEDLAPMKRRVLQTALVNVGLVFLMGALLLMLTTGMLRRMMLRLRQMAQAVSALPEDSRLRTVVLPESGEDEVGKIAQAFSSLISRIDSYYARLLQEEKDKRHAQQLALQYQINPHFLFNSLYWLQLQMEESGMDEKISESVSQLGEVLHYNLKGNVHARLEEEEQMAKAYVQSMSNIKGCDIALDVHLPEALRSCVIPCFCLQPLLENAIRHGLIPGRPLRLQMTCQADAAQQRLTVTLENDGKPIGPERLEEIRRRLSNAGETVPGSRESIGILNIQHRLELIYGREAWIEIESEAALTRMRLVLPLRKREPAEGKP